MGGASLTDHRLRPRFTYSGVGTGESFQLASGQVVRTDDLHRYFTDTRRRITVPSDTLDTTQCSSQAMTLPRSHAAEPSSLAALFGSLDECQTLTVDTPAGQPDLVEARLGVAAGLFTALRAKHPATAHHCYRVALRCSSLAKVIDLGDAATRSLEVAALLHDIGKVGIPDRILSKPGPLTTDESALMDRQWQIGSAILSSCCIDPEVLEILKYAAARYDGKSPVNGSVFGSELPIGSRILSIADAYDAMTTEHVYRAALSRERALDILFTHAGTQFDPHLVRSFATLAVRTEADVRRMATRLRNGSSAHVANSIWGVTGQSSVEHLTSPVETLFYQRMVDAIDDGVVFVDSNLRIVLWNRGLEQLTGISRDGMCDKTWSTETLDLRDTDGNLIREGFCPIRRALKTGLRVDSRLTITRARHERVPVQLTVFPVHDTQHGMAGVTVLFQDVTPQANLEERVLDLHEKAITDQLTGIANRAEFDRVQARLIESCRQNGGTFSLVLCDIDHFKLVNDEYGHQAGDHVLIEFASQLEAGSRKGDVVARYGGEEFVMVCPDCDNATAERRAEEIRFRLSKTPQPALDGRPVTASFGVTELQAGDTPDSMLRRADRALYQAKDAGRNRVVQIGAGNTIAPVGRASSWLSWLQRRPLDSLLVRTLQANVPLNVVAEKIKGFISDHSAEIVEIEEDFVVLSVDLDRLDRLRRQSDRPLTLVLELRIREESRNIADSEFPSSTRTLVQVTIRAKLGRDRRATTMEQAELMLSSLKSYLIAQECSGF